MRVQTVVGKRRRWRHNWIAAAPVVLLGLAGGSIALGADSAPPATHRLRRRLSGAPLPSADIASTLVCGPDVPTLPFGKPEFQRHVVDVAAFPDALCNDGTPAALYFRPYAGEVNRDKWVINLHGGGSCQDGASCAARWCNCAPTGDVCPYTAVPTNFDRNTMTNAGPSQKAADGLNLRGDPLRPNPYGDYNQIELDYCTSDLWIGNRRAVPLTTVNPRTNEPVTYTVNFLGSQVLAADIATLRQDGVPGLVYTVAGDAVPLPDLDEATEVIFTGDSAGGFGMISQLDDLRTTLEAANVNCQGGGPCPLATYGLLDASVGPEMAKLDFGTYVVPQVRSYDDYLVLLSAFAYAPGSHLDASCMQYHAANPDICRDATHVLRNHVTTPFFVRMALRDSLISGNYVDTMLRQADLSPVTVPSFALALHDELTGFAGLSATAEEGSELTREPGVFAPGCTKHDTIHTTLDTFGTTITPPGGQPWRLIGVFDNWRTQAATPTNLLTESVLLTDTVCP